LEGKTDVNALRITSGEGGKSPVEVTATGESPFLAGKKNLNRSCIVIGEGVEQGQIAGKKGRRREPE